MQNSVPTNQVEICHMEFKRIINRNIKYFYDKFFLPAVSEENRSNKIALFLIKSKTESRSMKALHIFCIIDQPFFLGPGRSQFRGMWRDWGRERGGLRGGLYKYPYSWRGKLLKPCHRYTLKHSSNQDCRKYWKPIKPVSHHYWRKYMCVHLQTDCPGRLSMQSVFLRGGRSMVRNTQYFKVKVVTSSLDFQH